MRIPRLLNNRHPRRLAPLWCPFGCPAEAIPGCRRIMDGPRWSIIGDFPLCSPLIRPDRHGPSAIRIFLRYAAVQRGYIVCLPAVLNVHDNLRRRIRLIGPSIKRIQAEPNRFAPFESILYGTVFRMWRWLEDSDIPPQNEFPYRLRRLSGHLGRRQHSERNPGHNQYDYRVGPIHSATLVHTSESCLDFLLVLLAENWMKSFSSVNLQCL